MSFINERTKNMKQGAIRAMFDKSLSIPDAISLGIGEPDMVTPKLVCEACKKALDEGYTHYTPNAGLMILRETIAYKSYLKDVGYDPKSEIIVTNGGMGALSLLMAVILNPGDEVLVPNPLWLNYVAQVQYYGGQCVKVPTDIAHQFQLQPEVMEKYITPKTKAIILNTPSNPTGYVTSLETLKSIAKVAARHDLLVITDEVYNTLFYDGVEVHTIASLPGMKERSVVINSFSKSYAMTGWRIGFAAGPKEIIDRMTKCQENFNSCANAIGQKAAVTALEHPELCDELREVFAKRRTIIIDGLKTIKGIDCGTPNGAFYVFPNISSFGLSSEEFCNRLLDEAHVVCIPGSAFGDCGKGYMRISYATAEDKLKEAVERISRFCASL